MENRQRHGCVTSWLILMLIVNSLTAIAYLFFGENLVDHSTVFLTPTTLLKLGAAGAANVLFLIFLLKWKKWAFFGLLISSIYICITNYQIGVNIVQASFGLLGIVILYAILQIKKDGESVWYHLE